MKSWLVADLAMFASSVVLYLAARRAALTKLPVLFTNLAMFGPPLLLYWGVAWSRHQTVFTMSLLQLGSLVLAGIVFSYFSNRASLKSIEWSPNPGYSLVISKSYVVFTTIFAVLLFRAELTVRSAVGIMIIVLAGALVSVNPKESHAARRNVWFPLAMVAFFGWGLLSLTAKYFFAQGISPVSFLSCVSLTALVCILVENRSKRAILGHIARHWRLFGLISVAAACFNYFNFTAISLAPNVGYVNATNAASIGAVAILSILIFKDEFSWRKLAGVLGVIGGLILLLL